MTQQQFVEAIKRLSVAERIALIEAITRSLREDLASTESATDSVGGKSDPDVRQERDQRVSAVQRLRGIIKFEGEPPSDEELKEDYTNYLIEKYS